MKTIIYLVLTGIIAFFAFISCELTLALGSKLDLSGPEVEISSPAPRKAVRAEFNIKGTVKDLNPIQEMLITAAFYDEVEKVNRDFSKQWRYNGNGTWSVSNNFGTTWELYDDSGLEWNGSANSASWVLPVDMSVGGVNPLDGEYLFSVQAWDTGGMSDDKSVSTRVLIVDKDPPKVDIVNLVLFDRKYPPGTDPSLVGDSFKDDFIRFKELHDIPDYSNERFDPANIGRFLTQGFDIQWQVDDNHDVYSVDIRLYEHSVEIDGEPGTALPEGYIFKYFENLPPPPEEGLVTIKPMGKFTVPNLDDKDNSEINNPIEEKTTIKIVAACFDAAGNPNQEKVLGYIIYWPLADEPWIIFTDGMNDLDYYKSLVGTNALYSNIKNVLDEEAFMIYPGRNVRATAYHNHGVVDVTFSLRLFDYNEDTNQESISNPLEGFEDVVLSNTKRSNDTYSTIYPWDFRPLPRSGFFILEATTTSVSGKKGRVYTSIFKVQDISFPDFIGAIKPNASDPLFMSITDDNKITISGQVRDATRIETLDMVWINPQSEGYAAMSQLSYFKDPDYQGWKMAMEKPLIAGGAHLEEAIYDPGNPNKIWRLVTNWVKEDDDSRQVFEFTITIDVSNDLNIGVNKNHLISQMFLFKARNPDNRSTIITYAPQGDTAPPVINIENIKVEAATETIIYKPREFSVIPKFQDGDVIQINGTWKEDSVTNTKLDLTAFFANQFEVLINNNKINSNLINISPIVIEKMDGIDINWRAQITVGNNAGNIPLALLSDALMINSSVTDIGSNVAESSVSWLIQSDNLRLMRVSSESLDGTYSHIDDPATLDVKENEVIIFMEFSKPVTLKPGRAETPVLRLNSRGTTDGTYALATYASDLNTSQNTRQYFRYTVISNDDTTKFSQQTYQLAYLDVIGLNTNVNWSNANYPFTWCRGEEGKDTYEEIKVTNDPSHDNTTLSSQVYARRLPTTTINSNGVAGADYMFTFIAGKRIKIDTLAPSVKAINARVPQGDYSTGAEISIEVQFDKPVRVGTTLPRLQLAVTNGANTISLTSNNSADVRVSGNNISFIYRVVANDTTNGNQIVVTGHTGDITDLAGTALAATGISGFTAANRTLTGRYIDTIAPGAPTVRIQTSSANDPTTDANTVTNTVNGTLHTGNSGSANKTLFNIYLPDLWLAIQGNATGGAHRLQRIEYSITNDQSNFVTFGNITNTPVKLDPGPYNIIARQVSRAGNASAWTSPVSFTLNPGDLVTRIDSTTANGTYTNRTGRTDTINVTVHLRENIAAPASASITLNTTPAFNVITYTAAANTISFTYTLGNTHNTPTRAANLTTATNGTYTSRNAGNTANENHGLGATGTVLQVSVGTANYWLRIFSTNTFRLYELQSQANTGGNGLTNLGSNITVRLPLDVTAMTITARDTTGVQVDSFINIPGGTTDVYNANRLRQRKMLFVQTGVLERANLTTGVTLANNAALDNSGDAGLTDDTWAGNLQLRFRRHIMEGSGNITITQIYDDNNRYRLPAVLTESQVSKYRSARNFSTYYKRGVNGLSNNTPDTSTKFVLNYEESTIVTPNNTGTAIQQMAYDFLQSERVVLPITSQDVEITGDILTINLSGTNFLSVLGAQYNVVIDSGLVQDSLGYTWPTAAQTIVYRAPGINKPSIRIDKKVNQDRITPQAGSATATQLVAHFDRLTVTSVRFDSRTPNANVRYNAAYYEHSQTNASINAGNTSHTGGGNWRSNATESNNMIGFATTGTGTNGGNTSTNLVKPVVNETGTDTAAIANWTTGVRTYDAFTGTNTANAGPHVAVGTAAGADGNISGYTWRVNARSRVTIDGTDRNSTEAEEAAFRTVFTYELAGLVAGDPGVAIANGESLWIRGGDALSTSSTPGFPLTWSDNYGTLNSTGSRAGVRLMRKEGTFNLNGTSGDNPNRTQWRYVTWEINVRTWHDVICGQIFSAAAGTAPTAAMALEAWQYGPRVWRYPRGGWVADKDSYTLNPGRHRWVYNLGTNEWNPGGRVNFTDQINVRDTPAVSSGITMPAAP